MVLMNHLTFDPIASAQVHSVNKARRIHFYPSSVVDESTGQPLLSVAIGKEGLRLTRVQVVFLRDALSRWITWAKEQPCGN